ncbi:uncharacterized protein zbbx isoform X3 [Dunckerocampus dactyliophorus]|uniref:uncharacterized protein zbbx isoform X3 n=1 Tax=Dunckerocampus dactyliophorus TaxID=161453 RepID=UPI002405F2E3|nr:uncharacterized protein zbbx isoform X3 [Dunckerocampus dactyliophorus]
MNLNDLVAFPFSKSKSLQFSSRNPQGLQTDTAALAQQGNAMEEMLQKLKESMKKEKGERGHSGIFQWKSGQRGSVNSSSPIANTKKTQKQLSAGKVKIRVLKDEPLTVPPHLPLCETCCCPQPTRQNEIRGPTFGQDDTTGDGQNSLLGGQYDEEESARSFQEALKQWRKERCISAGEQVTTWTQTVSMPGVAVQADIRPERSHEGQEERWGNGKVPIKVEFPESRLTYMDRLLLRKHRRTPVEASHPLLVSYTAFKSMNDASIEEEQASSLTAQDEDFRRYFASLFAVPMSGSGNEPPNATQDVLEDVSFGVLDVHIPSVKPASNKERELAPQTLLTDTECTGAQLSRQSTTPVRPRVPQEIHPLKPGTAAEGHSIKMLSVKSKPSYSTAESANTSTSSSKPQMSTSSPTIHKSKHQCGSPHSPLFPHHQTEIPNTSPTSLSSSPDLSPLIPHEHNSPFPPFFSLNSTFAVLPSSSALLPDACQSNPLQKGSISPVLPQKSQSSQLLLEPISSLTRSQSPTSNLETPNQSHQQSLLLLRSALSPTSSSTTPPPGSLKPLLSSTPVDSHFPVNKHDPLEAGNMEEEDISTDSECDMSSDSLD